MYLRGTLRQDVSQKFGLVIQFKSFLLNTVFIKIKNTYYLNYIT